MLHALAESSLLSRLPGSDIQLWGLWETLFIATDLPSLPEAFLISDFYPGTGIFLQVKPGAVWLGSRRLSCIVFFFFPGGEKISLRCVPRCNVPSESVFLFQSSPRVFDPFYEGKLVLLVSVHYIILLVLFSSEIMVVYLSIGWHTFRGIFIENKTHRK